MTIMLYFAEKTEQYGRKSISSSEDQADFCAKLVRISSSSLKDLMNPDDNGNDNDDNDERRNRVLHGMKSCIVTTEQMNTSAVTKRRSIVNNLKESLY